MNRRIITASLVGLVSNLIPVLAAPGLLGAAVIFHQGITGDHGFLYLAIAFALNFVLFFGATYYLFSFFSKPKKSN